MKNGDLYKKVSILAMIGLLVMLSGCTKKNNLKNDEPITLESYKETVAATSLLSRETVHSICFPADGGAAEMKYMLENGRTGLVAGDHRFADGDASWSYAFIFPETVTGIILDLDISGQYKIELSTDNKQWKTAEVSEETADRKSISLELDKILGAELESVYIRFSDSRPADGFGPSLWSVALSFKQLSTLQEIRPVGPESAGDMIQSPATKDERPAISEAYNFSFPSDENTVENSYLFQESGSGLMADHRFSDNSAFWIYGFEFPERIKSAWLELEISGQYKIEVSTDAKNWEQVGAAKNIQDKGALYLDISQYLKSAEKLYVRFSDETPSDGFGASLYNFKIWYSLSAKADNALPKGIKGDGNIEQDEKDEGGEVSNLPAQAGGISFSADGGAVEKKYMLNDRSTGMIDNKYRFADGNDSWTYYFDFSQERPQSLYAEADIGGQYRVCVSTDGVNWKDKIVSEEVANRSKRVLDLSEDIKSAPGVYIRFQDSNPVDGFGASLWKLSLAYQSSGGKKIAAPSGPTHNAVIFSTGGSKEEAEYMYLDKSTGVWEAEHRYADGESYWIYGFVLSPEIIDIRISLDLGGQYEISASTDGKAWETVDTTRDISGRTVREINLNSILKSGADKLFIRFSDSDVRDGFGPSLWNFKLEYILRNGKPDNRMKSFHDVRTDNNFIFDCDGSQIENNYLFKDSNSSIFENQLRFADKTAYWIYGFQFSDILISGELNLMIGGQYKVEASSDGINWYLMASSKEKTGTNAVSANIPMDLLGSDKLYVRFSDMEDATDYGPALKSFGMTYVLDNQVREDAPSGIKNADTVIDNPGSNGGYSGNDNQPGSDVLKNTYSFQPNGSIEELKYLYEDSGSGLFGGDRRFADSNAYWIYGFKFSGKLEKVRLRANIDGQYRISVSNDGVTWSTLDEVAISRGKAERILDLSAIYQKTPAESESKLYLKFSDSVTEDGFGPALYNLQLEYDLEGGILSQPEKIENIRNQFGFMSDGNETEAKYIWQNNGSDIFIDTDGNKWRFADGENSWIYGFQFSEKLEKGSFQIKIGGQYEISWSLDGIEWQVLSKSEEVKALSMKTMELPQEASGADRIYIKISDAVKEDGFGPVVWSFNLAYSLKDGKIENQPEDIPKEPAGTIENAFSMATDGTALETQYLYEDNGSGTFDSGTEKWRFADNSSSWVYGFGFSDALSSAKLELDLGGQYQVSISSDGSNWLPLAGSVQAVPRSILKFELPAEMDKTTKLYIKFSDADTSDGFGPGLQNLTIKYKLVGGASESAPGTLQQPAVENVFSMATDGTALETHYLNEDNGSGTFDNGTEKWRFADNSNSWVYGFGFSDALSSAKLELNLGGQYQVSISSDGSSWLPLAGSVQAVPRSILEYELSAAVGTTNLYIKFSDADTSDGFGPGLQNLTIKYKLMGGASESAPGTLP